MSSVAHARVRTIDRKCLSQAAKDLGINVQETADSVNVGGVHYKFGKDGNVEVSYWDDIKSSEKTAKNLAQLSTFYTMKNRLEAKGMRLKNSTKDVVLAVKANQKLVLEMEQADETVNAGAGI